MFFKLKKGCGNHSQKGKDGSTVLFTAKEGRVIESESDLAAKCPEKFERVNVSGVDEFKKEPVSVITEEPVPVVKEAVKEVVKKKEPVKVEEKIKPEPLGKDVTKNFPHADEEDFKVFYVNGQGYFVTESDQVDTALNKKKLKKAEVEAFIDKYLKE
jgi:hypothetical protein